MLTPSFSTTNLFARIKKLVATERRIGVEILECLYEIERRKAYSALRYDGLFTYCVKELGFSDSQAYQRIQAMRALKEMPELKPKIESGALSVSSVSKVQSHLKREKKSGKKIPVADKLALFTLVENKTSREVDLQLAEIKGEKLKTKLVLDLDEELVALWKRVKDLSAHKTHAQDTAVFKLLLKDWVQRNDPAGYKSQDQKRANDRRTVPSLKKSEPFVRQNLNSSRLHSETILIPQSVHSLPARSLPSPYIPASLRREIWKQSLGKCKNCASTHALEIDHIHPYGKGGETNASNLRLLCRSCNQFAAIQAYGVKKIEHHKY